MLIDTHSHLDRYLLIKRFGQKIDHVLRLIEDEKILTISNSTDLTSYRTNLKLAKRCRYVLPAFGIHPWNAERYVKKTEIIEKIIDKTEFIGEIGLDHFFIKDKSKYDAQRKIFELFLSSAVDKIISVHTKGAEREVLYLLRKHKNKKVIIHWYSGDISVLKEMIEEGYYFSICPEVKYSEQIREIVRRIPLGQLLTETDNPGGPASYLGEMGMPTLIHISIDEIGQLKDIAPSTMEQVVFDNFVRLTGSYFNV